MHNPPAASRWRSPKDVLKAHAAQRSLAHFIELSRRQLGLSSVQLAEKAEISLANLLAIETGKGAVGSPETVIRLANYLEDYDVI